MKKTDEIVFEKIKNDDDLAFNQLFRKYYSLLLVFAIQHVKHKSPAEEIVQELFLELWQNRKNINIQSSLKSYLFRSVYYKCMHHFKKAKMDNDRMVTMDESSISNSIETDYLVTIELEQKIYEVIESLPKQCKIIFKLSRFEQLKYKEIAEKLKISIKAAIKNGGKVHVIRKIEGYSTTGFIHSIIEKYKDR